MVRFAIIEQNNVVPIFAHNYPAYDVTGMNNFRHTTVFVNMYFLHSIKVGTLDWACPFPADASLTSSSAVNSQAIESP